MRPRRGVLQSNWHWILFYGAIVLAWCALFGLTLPLSEWRHVGIYGWDLLFALCASGPSTAGPLPLVGMWGLMSVAMMLPTFVPALQCYENLRLAGAGDRRGFAGLTAGFLSVWTVFSVLMAAIQHNAHAQWERELSGAAVNSHLAAALFVLAGLYQFSGLKQACLSRCRDPLAVFMAHWREDRSREFLLGLRMGAVCLGCCWLLMSFALISGTMSLIWMGLATVVMTVEKLPALGRVVSAPLGITLLAGALWVALSGQIW